MLIKSTRVWVCGRFLSAIIEVEDKKITRILPYSDQKVDYDFGDKRVLPGFIDIHCHGAYGFDTNYADPEGLKNWAKNIVNEGITSFCPTTITELKPVLLKAVKNVAAVKKENIPGADILGIHFEGPYLDMEYKGAQPPEAIVAPSVEEFKEYQEAAEGLIKVITLAPEHDPDFALTRYCSSHNVAVSMGHTGATFEEASLAIANGVTSVTHTFNGQTALNHRKNGVAGAALRTDEIYSEMICDLNHVTADAIHIFFNCKGKDHAIMISDALMCKGSPAGTHFMFGGHEIVVFPDGSAHLVKEGNLAGSTMRTNEGLRNVVEKAMVPFEYAINSCTINPARLLHVDDHIGLIRAGYDADITVLEDNYEVVQTFCKGVAQL